VYNFCGQCRKGIKYLYPRIPQPSSTIWPYCPRPTNLDNYTQTNFFKDQIQISFCQYHIISIESTKSNTGWILHRDSGHKLHGHFLKASKILDWYPKYVIWCWRETTRIVVVQWKLCDPFWTITTLNWLSCCSWLSQDSFSWSWQVQNWRSKKHTERQIPLSP